jgi:hypothetical protein
MFSFFLLANAQCWSMLGEELSKKEDRRFCSAVHLVVQDELYSPQVNRFKPKIKVKALTQHL